MEVALLLLGLPPGGDVELFLRDIEPLMNINSRCLVSYRAAFANGIALCIERKRSADALDASEVRYRTVVESIKEVIFQIDTNGNWAFLNPAWTEITGFKLRETIGTHFAEYIHPEDREQHAENIREVAEHRKSYCRDETRYLAEDAAALVAVSDRPRGHEFVCADGRLRDAAAREGFTVLPAK